LPEGKLSISALLREDLFQSFLQIIGRITHRWRGCWQVTDVKRIDLSQNVSSSPDRRKAIKAIDIKTIGYVCACATKTQNGILKKTIKMPCPDKRPKWWNKKQGGQLTGGF
jgi:hypothetical protein